MRSKPTLRMPGLIVAIVCFAGCGRDEASEQVPAPTPDAAPVAVAPMPVESEAARNERRQKLIDAAQQSADWSPELTPTATDGIDDTLARADAALEEGRIETGEGNALGLYLSVIEADPDNATAQAGVHRIAEMLQQRIDAALAERRYADAAAAMPVLRRLRGGAEPGVVALQQRIDLGLEITVLLQEAQRLADEGRALEPIGASAADVYREVLARDGGDPTALEGLVRLEAELVAQATVAAEAGDYARSDRLLADAARVNPGSGNVQDASTRIVELRQGRAGELMQQAYDAAGRGDVVRATQLLEQLEQVSAQSQGIEELRQRIEQARLYGGYEPGQLLVDALADGFSGPEMRVLPAGEFRMGSPRSEDERKKNEGPRHTVTLARGFALARSETTVMNFRRFVDATGYVTDAEERGRSTIYDERSGSLAERTGVDWRKDHAGRDASPDLPVVHVSWNDAKAYADWLARETGERYRLPTEAEFEYALRAGSETRYPWGEDAPTRVVANLTGDADRSSTRRSWSNAFDDYDDGHWGPAPVARYPENAFGLHDVVGNVSEWIEDCWHDSYARAPADGSAWVNPGCSRRVIRGASWASAPDQARSAFRISAAPRTSNARVGFRVARDL